MNEEKPDETFAAEVEAATLELPPPAGTAPGDAEAIKQMPEGLVMASPPLRPTSGRPNCPTCASPRADLSAGCPDGWHMMPQADRLIGDEGVVVHEYEPAPADPDAALDARIKAAIDVAVTDGHELRAFTLGYRTCFEVLYGGVSEASDGDIERLYRQKIEDGMRQAALREEVGDVQAWAAQQDQLDPAVSTDVRSPALDELAEVPPAPWDTVAEPSPLADMQEVMGGEVHIPMDSEGVRRWLAGESETLEGLDVEKFLREQQAEIDRLNQASLRDTLAVQNWAAACDYFNGLLAGTRWGDGTEPLLTRVQGFIAALRA